MIDETMFEAEEKMDKAVEVLTGQPGTDVTLSLLHEDAEAPVSVTLTRAIATVRVTPRLLTTASATTAATATGFCHGVGTAYAENVNAMAAELAVLPTTNDQPARKPGHSPSNCRPYR